MIDTLCTLKTIPLTTTIQDSIVTNTSIRGGIDIGVRDSLNFVLSGSPTIMLENSGQTDWTAIVGISSMLMSVIVLFLTYYYNRKLQKTETEEIRTRAIQEIAITKQAELYKMLADVNNQTTSKCSNIAPSRNHSINIQDKVQEIQSFLSINLPYIRHDLLGIAYEVLNIFSSLIQIPDSETMNSIDQKLLDYCDKFNAPYDENGKKLYCKKSHIKKWLLNRKK